MLHGGMQEREAQTDAMVNKRQLRTGQVTIKMVHYTSHFIPAIETKDNNNGMHHFLNLPSPWLGKI